MSPDPLAAFLPDLTPALSERDLSIISTVFRFGLITSRQLQLLFFTDNGTTGTMDRATVASRARCARRVLRRLTEARLLGRLERQVGGASGGSASYPYGLAAGGRRLLGLPARAGRLSKPDSPHIKHTLAIAELYVQLVAGQRDGRLGLLDHLTEPDCWVPAMGERLEPDSYLRLELPDGRRMRWYVEVDRGTPYAAQSDQVIQDKLDRYRSFWERQLVDEPVFPRVLFIAVHERRAAQLQAILDRQSLDSRHLFAATTFGAAVDVLTDAGLDARRLCSDGLRGRLQWPVPA